MVDTKPAIIMHILAGAEINDINDITNAYQTWANFRLGKFAEVWRSAIATIRELFEMQLPSSYFIL